jgi:glycosyltransferase involved in cell wall biosynthesis
MRLLIVSHTAHYDTPSGVAGWGPTIREIDQLATLFGEVRHVAPLHSGPAPAGALPYARPNVLHVPVPPAGGESLASKFRALRAWPTYWRVIERELAASDAVHVRCPANIALLAVVILSLRRLPEKRWIKYAGNWAPSGPEPWSYRLQRWLLRAGWHHAEVTVNGTWARQPGFVRSFLNPCLTEQELEEGRRFGGAKTLGDPMRLLFVGRLDEAKGCGRALGVLAGLRERGVPARLEVVGDGPELDRFRSEAKALGVEQFVDFRGWQPRDALARLYAEAHVLLLPSTSSEGWPKVLSEAMAYGAVPVASDVSSIPQYLERFQTGKALPARDRGAFVEALVGYARDPASWRRESLRGMEAAPAFSYSRHVAAVGRLLQVESP